MANKYSEELFGAIDEILRVRLQSINKDTTILCTVKDITDAETGKYIVENNKMRFPAYSSNTELNLEDNVWVLIPNGDYNSTKIILGKHVGLGDETFLPYADPLKNFVDITGNVINQAIGDYKLIANGEEIQLWFNNGENILDIDENSSILNGLTKIKFSGTFKTAFESNNTPKRGHYGVVFFINTATTKEELRFDSSNMNGNIYSYEGDGSTQSAIWAYDEEKNGQIQSVTGYFYQYADFYTNDDIYYPIETSPNLFLNNLGLYFGYSNDDISQTKAFLNTRGSLTYKYSTNEQSYKREIYPRLVYRFDNGTYKYVNSAEELWELRERLYGENYTGNYPRMHVYEQKLSIGGVDARAKEQTKEFEIPENTTIIVNGESKNVQDFSYVVTLDTEASTDRFKWIFSFKNKNLFTTEDIVKEINTAIQALETKPNGFIALSEDEEIGIQLSFDALSIKVYDNTRMNEFKTRYFQETETAATEETSEKLILEKALLNAAKEFYGVDSMVTVENASTAFLNYLKENVRYFSFDTADIDRNFDQVKARLEINYTADTLVFTNEQPVTDNIIDLIYDLKLNAVDQYRGIYNIYKSLEVSNGELINSKDEHTKRDLIATFGYVNTENEDIEKNNIEHVYWLIPRNNTMIKAPVEGETYGGAEVNHYKRLIINQNDFNNIIEKYTSGTQTGLYIQNTKREYLPIYKKYNGQPSIISVDDEAAVYQYDSKTSFYSITHEEMINDSYITAITDENLKIILSNRIKDFYIIKEDQSAESTEIKGNTNKQASISYQIKSIYNPSALNNSIYAIVYRNGKILEQNIALQFGVKGANELGYSLKINPILETAKNGAQFTEINAWTLGNTDADTKEIKFKIELYDNNNDLVNPSSYDGQIPFFTIENFNIKAAYGDSDYFNNPRAVATENYTYILEEKNNEGSNTNTNIAGIVLECKAIYKGYKIIGNYILPIRTDRIYDYIEGPSTITYDSNCTNPKSYSYSYSLFTQDGQEVEGIAIELINTNTKVKGFEPEVKNDEDNNKIIPKLGYLNKGINYSCYIKIGEKQSRTETEQDGEETIEKTIIYADPVYWYQPIFINAISNKDEDIIKWSDTLVLDVNVLQDLNNKPVSSVLTAGQLEAEDDKQVFTGVIIGDYPIQSENETENFVKTGLIGLKKENITYSFTEDGCSFLAAADGTKLINIDVVNEEYYIQSKDKNNNTPKLKINLKEGTISGNVSIGGNAGTATKLATPRNLKVALNSTTDVTFDGSENQNNIPISGTLGITHGGTGATTAASAWAALGGGDSGKHPNDYYALASHGNHLPSGGSNGSFLKRNTTGYTWSNLTISDISGVNKTGSYRADVYDNNDNVIGYVVIPNILTYN